MSYSQKHQAAFIAIDWGSNNFRAYIVSGEGLVLHRIKARQGVLRIREESFAAVLKRLLGKWLNKYRYTPIFLFGAIGSRQGWQEITHLEGPVGIEELTASVEKVANHQFERDIYLIPGVRITDNNTGLLDVIRGEEIQIVGALRTLPVEKVRYFCLPGLQTKWVKVVNDKIVDIHTFMTGEIFSVLSYHSSLAPFIEQQAYSYEGFKEGIEQDPSLFLHEFFNIRIKASQKKLHRHEIGSYLSGLLMHQEILGIQKMLPDMKKVTVVGLPWLISLYEQLLSMYGIECSGLRSDVAGILGVQEIYYRLFHAGTAQHSDADILRFLPRDDDGEEDTVEAEEDFAFSAENAAKLKKYLPKDEEED
jgi:2-dehydro-3-deoxygalactonokinase